MGNLLSVHLPNGSLTEYVLDSNGRRLMKKLDGYVQYRYLYGGGPNPIAELDADNNVVVQFIYGTRSNVPDYMIRDGITYRMITDHLGSVRMVVEATLGFVVQRIDYDEFGNELYNSDPDFQPFGYAGGLIDRDTKLVKFGVRDYDSYIGRWVQKDPIGFEGGHANLYAYCMNDPINFIDVNGLLWDSFFKGVVESAVPAFLFTAAAVAFGASTPFLLAMAIIGVGAFGLEGLYILMDPCSTPEDVIRMMGHAVGGFIGSYFGNSVGGAIRSALSGQKLSPSLKAAARGRGIHKNYNYPPGYEKEVALPSGKRMDAYNATQKNIMELKPNNQRAIKLGTEQLRGYINEANSVHGDGHTGKVITYD